jgi:hypothetical protein
LACAEPRATESVRTSLHTPGDAAFDSGAALPWTLRISLAVESADNRRPLTANDSYGQPWECAPHAAAPRGDATWNGFSGFVWRVRPVPVLGT